MVVESGEASRGLRSHVKEPEKKHKRRRQHFGSRCLNSSERSSDLSPVGRLRASSSGAYPTGCVSRPDGDTFADWGGRLLPLTSDRPRSLSPAALGEGPSRSRRTRVRIPPPPLVVVVVTTSWLLKGVVGCSIAIPCWAVSSEAQAAVVVPKWRVATSTSPVSMASRSSSSFSATSQAR